MLFTRRLRIVGEACDNQVLPEPFDRGDISAAFVPTPACLLVKTDVRFGTANPPHLSTCRGEDGCISKRDSDKRSGGTTALLTSWSCADVLELAVTILADQDTQKLLLR